MTHLATQHAIAGLYNRAAAAALECDKRALNGFAAAAREVAAADAYREEARDYASILRQIDPENAHPDVPVGQPPLIAQLRAVADFLNATGVPNGNGAARVQVHIHNVTPVAARHFAETVTRLRDASTREHRDFLTVTYAGPDGIGVDFALYFDPNAASDEEPESGSSPAAVEEGQADPAEGLDPGAVSEFIGRGLAACEGVLGIGVDPLVETAAHPILPRPSREDAPIQVGDRVRVHRADEADTQGLKTFPSELEGREGTVTEVEKHAFDKDWDGADDDDPPIVVRVDDEAPLHCFAVVEVTVLVRIEDAEAGHAADQLTGQPA